MDILRITDREIIMCEPVIKAATHEEICELWDICMRIGQRCKEQEDDE